MAWSRRSSRSSATSRIGSSRSSCCSRTRPWRRILEAQSAPSLYRIHEEPDLLKVAKFEEFVTTFGLSLGAPHERAPPAPLPEADRAHRRQARGEADRLPDAADDAEGAVLAAEQRALRPRHSQLHALHVAHPPLSGSGRAPLAPRCPPRPADRTNSGRRSTRTCRRSRVTPRRWSAAPTTPSANCCSGRR